MKKGIERLTTILLVIVMMFSLAACSQETKDDGGSDETETKTETEAKEGEDDAEAKMGETMAKIKKEGKIVMGVNATYAPFEFHKTIDGKDEIVGFDIELGQAIADELGVEFEVSDMSFDGLLPALATGKVDFLPGLAYSEERAENASFTKPYHKSVQVVLVGKDSTEKITADSDLSGKTIGILKGAVQEKTFPAHYPDAKTYVLGKIPDLIAALQSGRIDGVCLDYVVASLYEKYNEDLKMSEIQYELTDEEDAGSCVLVRKDNNEDLIEVINTVLDRVIENGDLEKWEEDAIDLMDMDDIG
ncbi:MAG: transporter substrate-binding domain-containing protein [Dorea sp.]|jgi:ABC-type amino acid transport substrate-binding protein|nr:transporter substrate-binding domain-containing protein [Dorea sp.]